MLDLFDLNKKLACVNMQLKNEIIDASTKFPPFNSAHEGYAIILEEVDEMWESIKENDLQNAKEEAIQVAAMAIRFLLDVK